MRIHILCDSPKTRSGFSVVGRHLYEGLKNLGHEMFMTGFQTTHENERFNDIDIMPINVQYIDDISQYIFNVQNTKADICICIFNADDAAQNEYAKVLKPCWWYVPIEGSEISDLMVRDLSQVGESGKIIAQCNWGKNEMMKAGIESTTIYHGFDPTVFGKRKKSESDISTEMVTLLKYYDGKWNGVQTLARDLKSQFTGKFVFGFVGANHGLRKRIERLLTAYSLFLKDNKQRKDRTLLVLRTMPMSVTGINLIKICAKLEISKNIIFIFGDNNRMSDTAMNEIYNCFDVNISASSSEGFGLAQIESMACGIPQIGPYCSSFVELIGNEENSEENRGLLAKEGEWQMIPDLSYRFVVNEKCLANKMADIYNDKDMRNKFSKNCIQFANQFTWEKVMKDWNQLINQTSEHKLQ